MRLAISSSLLALLLTCPAWAAITLECQDARFDNGTTVTIPTSTCDQEFDIVYVAISKDDTSAPTSDDGLTLVAELNEDSLGDTRNCSVWRDVIGATPPSGNYTFSQDNEKTLLFTMTFRGMDNATPEDGVTPSEVSYSNDTTPSHTAITMLTDNAWLLAVMCTTDNDINQVDPPPNPNSPPTNYTEIADNGTSSGGSAHLGVATVDQNSAGGSGAPEWTSVDNNVDSTLILLSLRTDGETPPVGGAKRRMSVVK